MQQSFLGNVTFGDVQTKVNRAARANRANGVVRGERAVHFVVDDHRVMAPLDPRRPVSQRLNQVRRSRSQYETNLTYSRPYDGAKRPITLDMYARMHTGNVERIERMKLPMFQGGGEVGIESKFFDIEKMQPERIRGIRNQLYTTQGGMKPHQLAMQNFLEFARSYHTPNARQAVGNFISYLRQQRLQEELGAADGEAPPQVAAPAPARDVAAAGHGGMGAQESMDNESALGSLGPRVVPEGVGIVAQRGKTNRPEQPPPPPPLNPRRPRQQPERPGRDGPPPRNDDDDDDDDSARDSSMEARWDRAQQRREQFPVARGRGGRGGRGRGGVMSRSALMRIGFRPEELDYYGDEYYEEGELQGDEGPPVVRARQPEQFQIQEDDDGHVPGNIMRQRNDSDYDSQEDSEDEYQDAQDGQEDDEEEEEEEEENEPPVVLGDPEPSPPPAPAAQQPIVISDDDNEEEKKKENEQAPEVEEVKINPPAPVPQLPGAGPFDSVGFQGLGDLAVGRQNRSANDFLFLPADKYKPQMDAYHVTAAFSTGRSIPPFAKMFTAPVDDEVTFLLGRNIFIEKEQIAQAHDAIIKQYPAYQQLVDAAVKDRTVGRQKQMQLLFDLTRGLGDYVGEGFMMYAGNPALMGAITPGLQVFSRMFAKKQLKSNSPNTAHDQLLYLADSFGVRPSQVMLAALLISGTPDGENRLVRETARQDNQGLQILLDKEAFGEYVEIFADLSKAGFVEFYSDMLTKNAQGRFDLSGIVSKFLANFSGNFDKKSANLADTLTFDKIETTMFNLVNLKLPPGTTHLEGQQILNRIGNYRKVYEKLEKVGLPFYNSVMSTTILKLIVQNVFHKQLEQTEAMNQIKSYQGQKSMAEASAHNNKVLLNQAFFDQVFEEVEEKIKEISLLAPGAHQKTVRDILHQQFMNKCCGVSSTDMQLSKNEGERKIFQTFVYTSLGGLFHDEKTQKMERIFSSMFKAVNQKAAPTMEPLTQVRYPLMDYPYKMNEMSSRMKYLYGETALPETETIPPPDVIYGKNPFWKEEPVQKPDLQAQAIQEQNIGSKQLEGEQSAFAEPPKPIQAEGAPAEERKELPKHPGPLDDSQVAAAAKEVESSFTSISASSVSDVQLDKRNTEVALFEYTQQELQNSFAEFVKKKVTNSYGYLQPTGISSLYSMIMSAIPRYNALAIDYWDRFAHLQNVAIQHQDQDAAKTVEQLRKSFALDAALTKFNGGKVNFFYLEAGGKLVSSYASELAPTLYTRTVKVNPQSLLQHTMGWVLGSRQYNGDILQRQNQLFGQKPLQLLEVVTVDKLALQFQTALNQNTGFARIMLHLLKAQLRDKNAIMGVAKINSQFLRNFAKTAHVLSDSFLLTLHSMDFSEFSASGQIPATAQDRKYQQICASESNDGFGDLYARANTTGEMGNILALLYLNLSQWGSDQYARITAPVRGYGLVTRFILQTIHAAGVQNAKQRQIVAPIREPARRVVSKDEQLMEQFGTAPDELYRGFRDKKRAALEKKKKEEEELKQQLSQLSKKQPKKKDKK